MQNDPGPSRRQTDVLDPDRAHALLATLGARDMGLPDRLSAGDALPPLFHQIYFWDARPPALLGRDGHPRVGDDLIPDMGLPRRMWAGGRLEFLAPLRVGLAAEKRSRRTSVQRKSGRSGDLAFVTLDHEIWQDGMLCLRDSQDLVYREEARSDAPKPTPPEAPASVAAETVAFSSTMLFRYSALTFNGHRIHYDPAYARDVEGYDGLVVHGPLLAQLLMLKAARQAPLRRFAFRGTAALMDFETADLCQDGARMWVRGPDGRLCMTAEVETENPA